MSTIAPSAKMSRPDLVGFLLQATELLFNLVERCDLAASALTDAKMVVLLIHYLDPTHGSLELAEAVGMLLCLITDDNPQCAQQVLSHPPSCAALSRFLAVRSPDSAKINAVAACVIWNCHRAPATTECTLKAIFPTLCHRLSFNAPAELQALAPLIKAWHARRQDYLNDPGYDRGAPRDDGDERRDDHDDGGDASGHDGATSPSSASEPNLDAEPDDDGDPVIVGEESILETQQGIHASQRPSAIEFRRIDAELKQQFRRWLSTMQATQLALEVLTNLTSGDCYDEAGNSGGWDDREGNSDDDEGVDHSSLTAGVPSFVRDLIVQSSLVGSKLQALCHFPEQAILEGALKATNEPRISSLFETVQARALSLLANLFLALDFQDLGEPKKYWDFLCRLCGLASQRRSVAALAPTTNALWALLRKSHQLQEKFIMSPDQARGIFGLTAFKLSEEVRMHTVGILGILGQQSDYAGLLPTVASALLAALEDPHPLVMAEAANSIFDVFAEPDHNAVCEKLGMGRRLNVALQKNLAAALSEARESGDRELFERLDEVRINMRRFLQYKKNQSN